ncbi:uncharacterized protein HRG_11141 [Hirsutella rhossiliensis]|uniref:Uncharacterized protein n=1 Tax=Hirsutella rhossiliensis TaxID=111463 RepID=A0A9P8SDS8_9HYPO|nr:uncharacterized protein HRG_11141 [Hirsutella rhossiliensis]KAH0957650.1 hypothetical protein HRG_11141 [Hirsutella rhossiliensis]
MLSIRPQEIQHHHHNTPTHTMPHRVSVSPVLSRPVLGSSSPRPSKSPQDAAVAQALEIAREGPDGASDRTVSKILERALAHAWGKVQAQPESYVMTRDEFAVFNFFQHRFTGDRVAVTARKRYWDNAHAYHTPPPFR